MNRKILVSALIMLFIASIIPVLADESVELNLTVTILTSPIADTGGPYSGISGSAIKFDGTHSYDPDGAIESYAWDFGDGGTGTGPKPSHTYSSTGTFTVELNITYGDGLTDIDTTTVTISTPTPLPSPPPPPPPPPTNKAPVADAGPDRTGYVDVAIHLNGAGSHDPDGTIEEYHWFPGDGSYKPGVKVIHIYEEAGIYTASLTVTDNNGATSTDNCTVTIHPMPVETQAKTFETVSANHTGYVVDALDTANTTVTVNTTDTVTVTVIKYESNPHPEDPMPDAGIPKYADIFVSDPDAVDWPIYVEMFYTDEEIEGLDEYSLGIYYWFNGTWQRCSDTGVDTERNVVWAYMTAEEASGSPILIAGMHAIITPSLPPILSNLRVAPAELERGDNVSIRFDIENYGSPSLTYIVNIRIENVNDSPPTWPHYNLTLIYVELGAYESKTVSCNITMDTVGEFKLTIDGMTGSFTVEAPEIPLTSAEFVVSDLAVSPDEVEEGEYVTFSVKVTNIGETEGSYTVEFTIDGETIETENVTLARGDSTTVSFEETWSAGTYKVNVENLMETVIVRGPPLYPAEFEFSNLEITPRVEEGMSVNISVDVTNVGEEMGGYTVELKVNGEVVDSVEIPGFGGGVTATQFFELTRGEGTYEVEVDGLTGSFTVFTTPEPPFWMRPGFGVGIIIVVIVVAAILYANWKGILPSLFPEIDPMRSNGNEKGADRRNKI